jgi:dihydroorotate dehydrogenase
MFRLEKSEALINRLGFNNEGVDRFVDNVARSRYQGVLGINIGRNFDTPNERAADDYVACMRKVYAYASYITINISSPNTKGLRDLQSEQALGALLAHLKSAEAALTDEHGRRVPLVVKIAPDLDAAAIDGISRLVIRHRIDGVIATNTTLARDGVSGERHADEPGGLSGKPLREKSTAATRALARALDGALPIIGVGGIFSGADACDKIDAGATLVQLYTGLIYRGPALVAECVKALAARPR